MKFSEAATEWLHQRSDYLKPRTFKTYRLETAALTLFFKERRLCAINNQDIREYQRRRTAGLKPFKFRRNQHHVNNEVRTLQHILTRANLWHLPAGNYERLNRQVRVDSTLKKMTEAFSSVGGAATQWAELTVSSQPAEAVLRSNERPGKVDVMDPAVQAQIARLVAVQREPEKAEVARRQVALALQRAGVERYVPVDQSQPAKGPRLIRFPVAG
jgi:hypothetical protein